MLYRKWGTNRVLFFIYMGENKVSTKEGFLDEYPYGFLVQLKNLKLKAFCKTPIKDKLAVLFCVMLED